MTFDGLDLKDILKLMKKKEDEEDEDKLTPFGMQLAQGGVGALSAKNPYKAARKVATGAIGKTAGTAIGGAVGGPFGAAIGGALGSSMGGK